LQHGEVCGRRLIEQSNCDGQFFIFDPAYGRSPILKGRIVDEELIVYNAQGYYSATYEGAHFVHVKFPGLAGVHSFEQFAKTLERSDYIRAIIAGSRSQLPEPAFRPPPTLELTAGAGTLAITVDAQSDSGFSQLEFYEDGRFEARRTISGPRLHQTIELPSRPHVRKITAVAVDSGGVKSRPMTLTRPARSGSSNTLHVVAVGIDDYDHLDPLQGAKHDAETLVTALEASALAYYRTLRATIRVNRMATPTAVQSDLRTAVEGASADDTILMFFAGHGGTSEDGRYFMATSSTDPNRLPETAIDWRSMADLLARSQGRVIVVIGRLPLGTNGARASHQ
jgi:hypothetical protein